MAVYPDFADKAVMVRLVAIAGDGPHSLFLFLLLTGMTTLSLTLVKAQ